MKERIRDITIEASCTIREVMQAIDKGALGVALMVDPKSMKFVGLVSDGDVRRALLNGRGLESPVSEIERPETITATIDMSMDEISSMFSEPIRIVPVLDHQQRVSDLAIFDSRTYLPVAEPKFGDSELKYVNECILTGWVSSAGKYVSLFEKKFAEFCSTTHAIASSSGTTALHLALVALGVGPGDEVIVPTLSFIATANAVSYTGATPVFVDSEISTWNIDPVKIDEAITPRTKAIIPVHLYGHPENMDPINEIARSYNLSVIEDAAEAHGALYKDKKVGSLGTMGIFSFYGNKTITTGEGGMIVTHSNELSQKLRILRDHGMDPEQRYVHPVLGYNYRMTNIQAALGVAQMERIEEIIDKKRSIADQYRKRLQPIPGIELVPEASWAKSIFWLYSILIHPKEYGITAKELRKELLKKGIETRPLFIPIHKQPIYETLQTLPVSEKLSRSGLSLPSSINLHLEEINRICNIIEKTSQTYEVKYH